MQREQLLPIRGEAVEESRHCAIERKNQQYNQQHPRDRGDQTMKQATPARSNERAPLPIDIGQVLLILNAAIETRNVSLRQGQRAKRGQCRIGCIGRRRGTCTSRLFRVLQGWRQVLSLRSLRHSLRNLGLQLVRALEKPRSRCHRFLSRPRKTYLV